ncbi:hypothetical protein [Coleofasciculus sp. E2-BRE-01]|uniref:hypothetical protein n=1 Tax=Coleofasciculus sp. E2-BRE-01 TaxID=3069524 RepID=UPI0040632D95
MTKFSIIQPVLALLLVTNSAACGIAQEVSMTKPVLPKLEIPENTRLLYENIAINDPDRTGNWRFLFRQNGCFFNARNTQLWIEDSAQLSSDDPDLHWNKPFPDTPNRCLTESQQAELTEAIRQVDFPSMAKYYPTPPDHQVSHPAAERWTVVQNGKSQTVVVENGFAPPELVQLRQKIDQLVANAPRP